MYGFIKRLSSVVSGVVLSVVIAAIWVGGEAKAQENVIIVLDSSGSMVGRIAGKPKIAIARRAIEDLLGTLRPDTRVGIIAYGHRRKGDCSDIETIYEVGRPDVGAIMRAVNRLKPIGKTPLGAAVRLAAKELRYTENKATVILVSDGKENCGVDSCQLGKELESKGVDFTAHVVGFDVRRGEEAGLQCLARATGGRYVAAVDATTLQKALSQTIKIAAVAKPAKPAEPVKPAKPTKPAVIAGLAVRVLVSKGGPVWSELIDVSIYDAQPGFDGKRKKIASAWRVKSGHVFRKIPPGRYLLHVGLPDHGHIAREKMIDIRAGAAQIETIVLDIGQVRFDAVLRQGGAPFGWQLGWLVYGLKVDLAGKRRKIADFWRVKTGQVFWLPAGKWSVWGVVIDARYIGVSKDIVVEGGGSEAHSFVLNAGLVRFDAKLGPESGNFAGQLGWNVYGPKVGLAGKRRKIVSFWRVKSGGIYILPAGQWYITGTLLDFDHVWAENTITVAPGSEELHTVVFGAGTIRIDATVSGKKHDGLLGFTILEAKQDLAGKRRKVVGYWRVRSGRITILPAGKYVLDARLVDKASTSGEITFEIGAGEEKVVAIDLKPH